MGPDGCFDGYDMWLVLAVCGSSAPAVTVPLSASVAGLGVPRCRVLGSEAVIQSNRPFELGKLCRLECLRVRAAPRAAPGFLKLVTPDMDLIRR